MHYPFCPRELFPIENRVLSHIESPRKYPNNEKIIQKLNIYLSNGVRRDIPLLIYT